MSCSFLYVFWEALWRNLRFHIQDVNIQIWFIDTTSLKRCRPVRSDLFHAVDLVQKKCERSSCSATPEQHTTALDFASVFDEVLVLGGVPPEAIIGNVTLAQLLLLLPPYFFTQVPSGCPIPRDCEHLIRGVPRLPLRDAHWELRRNVPTVDTLPHVFEQAELALKLARRVCRDVPLSESDVRDLLRRLALAIANWVIRWEDTMIPTFDNEWACSGSVWITEYLKYRISGGPVLRGARKVRPRIFDRHLSMREPNSFSRVDQFDASGGGRFIGSDGGAFHLIRRQVLYARYGQWSPSGRFDQLVVRGEIEARRLKAIPSSVGCSAAG